MTAILLVGCTCRYKLFVVVVLRAPTLTVLYASSNPAIAFCPLVILSTGNANPGKRV